MDGVAEDMEEMVLREDRHSKGRGGRGKGGRGGSFGAGGGMRRDVTLSKAMSRLLRHQAEKAGIKLDREGYAPLDRVVSFHFLLLLLLPSKTYIY